MTLVFPAPRAATAIRTALERALFWLATVMFGLSFLACVAYGLAFPEYRVWLSFPALTGFWAIAVCVSSFHALRWWALLPLAVAALAFQVLFVSTFAGFTPLIAFEATGATFLISAATIALTFTGALADRRSSGAIGAIVGFGIGQGGTLLGMIGSDRPVSVDVAATVVAVGVVVALQQLVHSNRRAGVAGPAISEADAIAHVRREREVLERRSAALVHDTILNELATLATSRPGPLPDRVLRQIGLSLALVNDTGVAGPADTTGDLTGRLRDVVARQRAAGLQVAVTGDLHAIAALTPERALALPEAVEQALVNVLRHSGTDHAELVIIAAPEEVTVMVTDDGRGFSESDVGSDRLGLRISVRERITAVGGSVQVWSNPGGGTSIVITLPGET